MGSLAKHLDKSDPKVKPIVAKLITALSTPSQQVSVSSCFLTTCSHSECYSYSIVSPFLLNSSHTLSLALQLMWFVIYHQVQESVASCLPPLVPAIKEDAAGIVRNLLQLLLESDKYAERKGAAYGLAGLVKGLGILALKQQDIMTTLTDAIQDKKNFRRREGQ